MFGNIGKGASYLAALARIEGWTRARFLLEQDETVLVAELACVLPGCPPLETVVAFWIRDKTRHHFKVFKRAEEVDEQDLPFSWMKTALAVPEGFDPYCC